MHTMALIHRMDGSILKYYSIEKDDGISPDNATLRALAERLELDYNYLLVLNGAIDDEPEVRAIQRAAKKMSDA